MSYVKFLDWEKEMTPENYEEWDAHTASLMEMAEELTPEQEVEWESHNAVEETCCELTKEEKDAYVRWFQKGKDLKPAGEEFGILYAENHRKKKKVSARRKQKIFCNRSARAMRPLVAEWAKTREGAYDKYRAGRAVAVAEDFNINRFHGRSFNYAVTEFLDNAVETLVEDIPLVRPPTTVSAST